MAVRAAGVLLEQIARMLDQFLTRFRGIGALADAVQERDVEALFQLMHLMRYGGLGEIEHLCGGGEAPAVGHFDEGAKLIKIQTAHDHKSCLSFA
jgi:hypothetical protein